MGCEPTKARVLIYSNSSGGTTPEAKEFRLSPKGQRTLKGEIQDYAYRVYVAEILYLYTFFPRFTLLRVPCGRVTRGKIDFSSRQKRNVAVPKSNRGCIREDAREGDSRSGTGFKLFTTRQPFLSLLTRANVSPVNA